MKLITRKFLNPNLKTYKNDKTYTFDDYQVLINKAKTFLIKERNVKPGQKIFFASTLWPNYLAWFIAASELGMSFVVSDFPLLARSKSVNKKLSLYGGIDHVIKGAAEGLEEFFSEEQNRFWKDKIIDHKAYEHSTEECSNEFWAQEDDILLYATSSGTTGTPKVHFYSQKFFYDIADRNAKLYRLKSSDKCLHTRNLHHGSVVGVYFLPTLKYCEHHYTYENPSSTKWVDIIQQHKVNRALFFYDMTDIFSSHADLNVIDSIRTEYFVLAPVKNDFLKFFKNNSKIYSVFGSGETCGPLFLPQVTEKMIETKNFKKPLDDFYVIDIVDGYISVTMPDGKVVMPGDKFIIKDGDYIHQGRNNLYRINGVALYLDILIKLVEDFTNKQNEKDFDIVIDQEYDQIYIRSNQYIDLSLLNKFLVKNTRLQHYQINKQINQPRENFFNGIKFDPFDVRLICRSLK